MSARGRAGGKGAARAFAATLKKLVPGVKKTDVHVGTWLDRPGTSTSLHLDGRRDGLRVVVQKWDDDAIYQMRLIEGDFRPGRGPTAEHWTANAGGGARALAAVVNAHMKEWRQ